MWEPTEISSYRATLSFPEHPPLTLTPASEPQQMSFSFTIQKSEWGMLQAQRCSEELHCIQTWLCNPKPKKSAMLFQVYLHTVLTYSVYVHSVKVQISQQPCLMLMTLSGAQFKLKLDTCFYAYLVWFSVKQNKLFFNDQRFDLADV